MRKYAAALVLCVLGAQLFAQGSFRRGDSNVDGNFDFSDVAYTLDAFYLGQGVLLCEDGVDANDDGRLDIADAVFSVQSLLREGGDPPPPFLDCGEDATVDALTCNLSPPCAFGAGCLDQQLIDDVLGGAIPAFSFCMPAGLLQFPLELLEITVCPESGAKECGLGAGLGCEISVESVGATLDLAEEAVIVRVEGRMDGLPIEITEELFGTTTTCEVDIYGADEELPFTFDLVIPLLLSDGSGEVVVYGVGDAAVGDREMNLSASGGLVCNVFEAAQDGFFELFLAPLAVGIGTIAEAFDGQLVGLPICVE